MLARMLMLLMLAVAAACASAAEGGMADDSRLDTPVSLSVPMQRLETALHSIGEQCGVSLTADPPADRDSLQLSVTRVPARTVLRQIAETLDYGWSTVRGAEGKPAYRLRQSLDSRTREQAQRLRQRQASAGELNIQLSLLQKYLTQYESKTPAEVRVDVDTLKSKMEGLPESKERWEAEREWYVAQLSQGSEARLLAAVWPVLTPDLRERLFLGERVLLATDKRPDALPLPPAALQALRAARQGRLDRLRTPERVLAREQKNEVVVLDAQRVWGVLSLRLRSRQVKGEGAAPGISLPGILLTASRAEFGPPQAEFVPGTVTADRPADLQRPVRFVWKTKVRRADQPLSYAAGVLPCEVMATIARDQPDLRIVGDAYWDPIHYARTGPPAPGQQGLQLETGDSTLARLSATQGEEGKLPLGELLREVAARSNTGFRLTRDGWLRCRSTIPFDLRGGQVDPALAARLFQRSVEQKAYDAGSAREAAAQMTYAQAERLSDPYLGFLTDLVGFRGLAGGWDGWRFLSRLPPARREELEIGKPLAYRALTGPERVILGDFLRDVSRRPSGGTLDLDLGPAELDAASLSLTPAGAPQRTLQIITEGAASPLLAYSINAQRWK